MGLLKADGLVAGYHAADEILKGVDLALQEREIVGVIGPNGAGKSTLLRVIAGLIHPKRGSVRFDGRSIEGMPPRAICAMGLAYVPQESNIFPTLSVLENLEIGGYVDPGATRRRLPAVLERFPTLQETRRHAARPLSGGQRHVLAMALALMVEPRLLLLDEPSAGLSPLAAERLFQTILGINRDGVAILMVEQNALEALAIAHRSYILVDGRDVRSGPAAELAQDPEVRRSFLGL